MREHLEIRRKSPLTYIYQQKEVHYITYTQHTAVCSFILCNRKIDFRCNNLFYRRGYKGDLRQKGKVE